MPTTQKSVWSYLAIPIVLTILGVGAAYYFGGVILAQAVFALILMEISLSFDNAVVNATVLRHWDEVWRKRFLFWGILIAVFGMRLIFPIVVVGFATGTPVLEWGGIIDMAINRPEQYHHELEAVAHMVDGFGGAFLMMVGLAFFVDATKDTHWLGPVEGLLTKAGQIEAVSAGLTLGGALLVSQRLPATLQHEYIMAAIIGVITFVGVKAIGVGLGGGDDGEEADAAQVSDGVGGKIIKAGIGGFLYLEVLDASFSFDGVIGAFAITNSLPWIMVGLGVGAFAVRELTIMAVDRGTLTEFKFLEHGAFYAIIALATIMLIKPLWHAPEWLTGTIGASFILVAFLHSYAVNKGWLPGGDDDGDIDAGNAANGVAAGLSALDKN